MHLPDRRLPFVREQVSPFQLTDAYDLLDLETKTTVGQFAEVRDDGRGWNLKLLDLAKNELGVVIRKWAGLGRARSTSVNNSVIAMRGSLGSNAVLLEASLAIDLGFKERK